jgi:wyosine [tRNA(Phe)-imidazoG37] synthetase (radical SAM superfamily)
LPSLDAVSDEVFAKVNRPCGRLNNAEIIRGIIEFRKSYKGQLWLEVFIVPGVNDTPEELLLFKKTIIEINPDRVQLNSLDRPGACAWVQPASIEKLREIADFLVPLPVEIISRQAGPAHLQKEADTSYGSIMAVIARRPSTVEEIAAFTGLAVDRAEAALSSLIKLKKIARQKVGGLTFYRVE